jgi:hypothetical protein
VNKQWWTNFGAEQWRVSSFFHLTIPSSDAIERVNRDAERENLHLEWDLGVPEDEEE